MNTEDISTIENRIAVVGCGHVGATSAYALMMSGVARELVLVDLNRELAEGEAMDLQHAAGGNRRYCLWSRQPSRRDAARPVGA